MESCYAVDKELEKLCEKYNSANERMQQTLDDFIASVQGYASEIKQSMAAFVDNLHRLFLIDTTQPI